MRTHRPTTSRDTISLADQPELLRGCFDALEQHDPGLGRIMATTAMIGLRSAEMEMLAVDAIDLVEGVIEPLCHSEYLKSSYRMDLVVLPIARITFPLLRCLVDEAVRMDRATLIEPDTTIRRWRHVREIVGPGLIRPLAMREVFAATAMEVCDDPMIVDHCLWRRSMRRLEASELLPSSNPRDLDFIFDGVADRLADIVLRPAFTTDPG